MNYKQSRALMWVLFAVGVVLIIASYMVQTKALIWAAVVVILGGAVQAGFFYRCPHCGEPFQNIRSKPPKQCPKCKRDLD